MKSMHYTAFILVIIGALNWGLIGLGSFMGGANWNVVHMLLGSWPMVENIVYVLVGLAALNIAYTHKKDCRMCNASGM
ncbi:MAG: DUF378 domain-containing protein [Candidatus Paceibacteria bacterium]